MSTTGLKNNAFTLNQAIENSGHCEPGTAWVLDGHHKGTLFTWVGSQWCVVDLENRKLDFVSRIAVVTLEGDADPDSGLNQDMIGVDLECGEWVVDRDDLKGLKETYGDDLVILWEQPA